MVPKRKHLQLRLCRNPKIKHLNLRHVDIDEWIIVLGTQTHHRKQYARNVRFQVTCVILRCFGPHGPHHLDILRSDKNPTRCILHRTTVDVFSSLVFDGRKQERYGDGHTQRIHNRHVRRRVDRKVFGTRQIDTVSTDVHLGHCRAKVLQFTKRQILFTEKDSNDIDDDGANLLLTDESEMF